MSKQGTPTMGGLMFILAIGIAVATWPAGRSSGGGTGTTGRCSSSPWCSGPSASSTTFRSCATTPTRGSPPPRNFCCSWRRPSSLPVLLRRDGYLTPDLYIPFLNVEIVGIPWVVFMVFAAFVMVGTVNAVNLTDGIDGLATGVTIPVALFYMAVSAWFGRTDLAILSAALAGGLAAFLIYNFHPAKVFMGDTGSLFLGGMVCGLAFALDIPLVIPIVGLVYVAEVLSDIIQVVYFKKTGGKRFFRMAPLHHHLEMGGWSETKLFCVFSGITLVLCLLAFLGVMNRYPM